MWERTTHLNYINAFVELAKYYEHKIKDYQSAIHWTSAAIDLITTSEEVHTLPPGISVINKKQKIIELNYRLKRLINKNQP